MNEEIKVKSLIKALKVLECFDEENSELGITQISEQLDLNKSNVYNIISTLKHMGYVEKNEATGKYKLGLKLLKFSFIINENLGYQRAVYDIMQDASNQLNAITYFAIPRAGHVFYLFSAYPSNQKYDFPFRTIVGAEAPFYCTSLGKAMLAFMKEEDAAAYISGPKKKFTENTIIDESELLQEIKKVQERGYSIDNCEHEYGVKCVGVPVLLQHGELLGAISISGAVSSIRDEILDKYVRVLKEAAFRIRERF